MWVAYSSNLGGTQIPSICFFLKNNRDVPQNHGLLENPHQSLFESIILPYQNPIPSSRLGHFPGIFFSHHLLRFPGRNLHHFGIIFRIQMLMSLEIPSKDYAYQWVQTSEFLKKLWQVMAGLFWDSLMGFTCHENLPLGDFLEILR